jgi:hypothetical protein
MNWKPLLDNTQVILEINITNNTLLVNQWLIDDRLAFADVQNASLFLRRDVYKEATVKSSEGDALYSFEFLRVLCAVIVSIASRGDPVT